MLPEKGLAMVADQKSARGSRRGERDRGFLEALVGDGRPLIAVTAVILLVCGSFAMFLAATGHFLPQDIQYLGMSAADLCTLHGCRIVHFMFHDRVAFGGTLSAQAAQRATTRVPIVFQLVGDPVGEGLVASLVLQPGLR